MRIFVVCLLLLYSAPIFSDGASFAISNMDLSSLETKEKIKELQAKTSKANNSQELSRLYLELSKAYLEDQDEKGAFEAFLQSLSYLDKDTQEAEEPLYKEALKEYLEIGKQETAQAAYDKAMQLIRHYSGKETPLTPKLGLVLAASYANIEKFSNFFDLFYASYPKASNHFIALKALGLLTLKLSEKANPVEKAEMKLKAHNYFLQALKAGPEDTSLFKIVIGTAPEKEKKAAAFAVMDAILMTDYVPSRVEIGPITAFAVDNEAYELAEKVITRAKSVYPYSRAVIASEEYLQSKKSTP